MAGEDQVDAEGGEEVTVAVGVTVSEPGPHYKDAPGLPKDAGRGSR